MSAPTPEQQLQFLSNIQRLLAEGQFVATYKFALLNALADLCVEMGPEDSGEMRIRTRLIAERFLAAYWRQARPYPIQGTAGEVALRQNTGKPPEILGLIHRLCRGGFADIRDLHQESREWQRAISAADAIIRKMPLWKLQTIAREQVSFLYENRPGGHEITLKPGVAYCFRRFHPLVVDLIRGAWVRFIRRHNAGELGQAGDLEEFLFGCERASLAQYVKPLRELQQGRCFYCDKEIRGQPHVDHFIPWSRYQNDFASNFVLADRACNMAKADNIACAEHLHRWAERNRTERERLASVESGGVLVGREGAWMEIARWMYSIIADSGGLTWERGGILVPLEPGWERALTAA